MQFAHTSLSVTSAFCIFGLIKVMLPINNGNPCQVVDDIHSIVNDTMQKHTPLQPLSRNGRKLLNKPWITQALYISIKKNKITKV